MLSNFDAIFDQLSALAQLFCYRLCVLYLGFVVLFLVFCILKLIGFVSAIHSEDPVTLCLSSLWMAQCNITLYRVSQKTCALFKWLL